MIAFIAKRLIQMIPALLGITLIVFVLLRASGDPVSLMLPDDATAVQIERLRDHLGLNEPILVQYGLFLKNILRGDFGESIRYNSQPALQIVLERLPATLALTGYAALLALVVSLILGVLAAVYKNTWLGHMITSLSVLGQAIPNFWLGIMLILMFSVALAWLPVSGRGSVLHMILPAVTLAAPLMAVLTRLIRSGMLEILNQDYIRTARAKGVSTIKILSKHALKNALIAYITVFGLQVANLLSGAVVTEQVFAYPGIGLLSIQAINARDMPLVQTIVIVASIVVMLVNLLVDIAYVLVDPRITYK